MVFQDFMQSGLIVNVALTLLVVSVLWLVRLLIVKAINRNVAKKRQKYKWRKYVSYFVGLFGLGAVIAIWFEGLQSIGTFLGLFAAGLAIALRGPLIDLVAWTYIAIRKPFTIGDRVQLGNHKGDVIDVRLFKFTILEIGNWVQADQSTGRVIHIPNHKVFDESLANYTGDFEFIWNELEVLLTFESHWQKAKDELQKIADKHLKDFAKQAEGQIKRASKSYYIHYKYLTPIVYTDVKESGIQLTIRYLCNPRRRRGLEHAIWEDVLKLVEHAENIDLAYPTMRIIQSSLTETDDEPEKKNPISE